MKFLVREDYLDNKLVNVPIQYLPVIDAKLSTKDKIYMACSDIRQYNKEIMAYVLYKCDEQKWEWNNVTENRQSELKFDSMEIALFHMLDTKGFSVTEFDTLTDVYYALTVIRCHKQELSELDVKLVRQLAGD
jgi:hypothetical protein